MAIQKTTAREDSVELTDLDRHLFHEGTHYRLYDKFGARLSAALRVKSGEWEPAHPGPVPRRGEGIARGADGPAVRPYRVKQTGAQFSVWAPNAEQVFVIGDFNQWSQSDPLTHGNDSGIWAGWIPNVRESAAYKYRIISKGGSYTVDKTDPFGFFHEVSGSASLVWDLHY